MQCPCGGKAETVSGSNIAKCKCGRVCITQQKPTGGLMKFTNASVDDSELYNLVPEARKKYPELRVKHYKDVIEFLKQV